MEYFKKTINHEQVARLVEELAGDLQRCNGVSDASKELADGKGIFPLAEIVKS